jgi:hypothetical protein
MVKEVKKPKKTIISKLKTAPKPETRRPDPKKSDNLPYPFSKERYCSFCRKNSNDVWRMIAEPNHIFICDNCVEVCNAIFLSDEIGGTNDHWRERITHLMDNPKKFEIPTDEKKPKSKKKAGVK